jgi:4a-hydroxytetrahydrobiopterin dehydratase
MNECSLAQRNCVPCRGEVPPLNTEEITKLLAELGDFWQVVNEHHLKKEFKFADFRTALDFTNKVGEIAEKENHHPDIYLAWGKVEITVWTHTIHGLSESDFILAAKISQIN